MIAEAVKEAVIPLQREIVDLKETLKKSEFAIAETTVKLDNLEQTNRRNNLRIEDISEMTGENTNQILCGLASEFLGVEIGERDLDSSHRVGKPNAEKSRTIIVRLTTYNIKKQIFKNIIKLKNIKDRQIYVNEDSTRSRFDLAYNAHQLVREKQFMKTWTIDGKIYLLKAENDKPQVATNKDDIAKLQQ